MRVVHRWLDDPELRIDSGKPKPLRYDCIESEFYRIVKETSSDVSVRSVLDYLRNNKLVKETTQGLKLMAEAFTPK